MIGVDTNVLLRFALRDDPAQTAIALAFFDSDERLAEPALLCPITLLEFVWTLRRREGFSKVRLLAILDALTASSRIAYSDESLMTACIERWRHGRADLADYLIAASNLQAGASTTITFDEMAAREPGFSPAGPPEP